MMMMTCDDGGRGQGHFSRPGHQTNNLLETGESGHSQFSLGSWLHREDCSYVALQRFADVCTNQLRAKQSAEGSLSSKLQL